MATINALHERSVYKKQPVMSISSQMSDNTYDKLNAGSIRVLVIYTHVYKNICGITDDIVDQYC